MHYLGSKFSLYSNWDIDPDIFGDPLSRSRAACLFILTQAYLFSQLRAVLELARFFFLPFKIFADKNRHRQILAGKGPFKYYVIKEAGGWDQKMPIFDDLQCCKSSKRRVGEPKKVKNMMT